MGNKVVRPSHYQGREKDLFDEWHERYSNDDRFYSGEQVFIEIMKCVAERYTRRYPRKDSADLSKGVYTLQRLEEYLYPNEGAQND